MKSRYIHMQFSVLAVKTGHHMNQCLDTKNFKLRRLDKHTHNMCFLFFLSLFCCSLKLYFSQIINIKLVQVDGGWRQIHSYRGNTSWQYLSNHSWIFSMKILIPKSRWIWRFSVLGASSKKGHHMNQVLVTKDFRLIT